MGCFSLKLATSCAEEDMIFTSLQTNVTLPKTLLLGLGTSLSEEIQRLTTPVDGGQQGEERYIHRKFSFSYYYPW